MPRPKPRDENLHKPGRHDDDQDSDTKNPLADPLQLQTHRFLLLRHPAAPAGIVWSGSAVAAARDSFCQSNKLRPAGRLEELGRTEVWLGLPETSGLEGARLVRLPLQPPDCRYG